MRPKRDWAGFMRAVALFSMAMMPTFSRLRLDAQEPTPIVSPVLPAVFPRLDCDSIPEPYEGPTWNAITIGSSTLDDVRVYLQTFDQRYTEHSNPNLNVTDFSIRSAVAHASSIPAFLEVCLENGSNVVTAIYITPILPQIDIGDLLSDIGMPDLVVWGEFLESRVLIWLTKGIAASVRVDESEAFVPYGTVDVMAYFPYQSLADYEVRWPYTHRGIPRPESVTLTPFLPYETNPFDFESLLATMTAEPERTSTPTNTVP